MATAGAEAGEEGAFKRRGGVGRSMTHNLLHLSEAAYYPNSEIIGAEYGIYGSTETGAKSHLRWTSDGVSDVEAYYDQFPFVQGHVAIIDSADDALQLTVCSWGIAFGRNSIGQPHPCDRAKNLLNERGGTLIEFVHDYFNG